MPIILPQQQQQQQQQQQFELTDAHACQCVQSRHVYSTHSPVSLHRSLSGFEHYFHCDQCDDFDICTDCLVSAKKDHHKGAHTFSEVDPEQDDSDDVDDESE